MELGFKAKKLLPDALWDEIAPLFSPDPARPKGGRPPVGSREALIGTLVKTLATMTPAETPLECLFERHLFAVKRSASRDR